MRERRGEKRREIRDYLEHAGASPFDRTLDRIASETGCARQYVERTVRENGGFELRKADKAFPGVRKGTLLVYRKGEAIQEAPPSSTAATSGIFGQRFSDGLLSIAIEHERHGRLLDAERQYDEALKEGGSTERQGWILTRLAAVRYHQPDYKAAAALLKRAQGRIRDRDSVLYADLLVGLAVIDNDLGKPSIAEARLREARGIYRRESDILGGALACHNLGHSLGKKGDHSRKFREFDRALQLFQEHGDKRWLALELWTIGTQKAQERRLEEALHLVEESQSCAAAVKDSLGTARAALAIGDIMQLQGRYPEARVAYDQALRLAARIGSRREVAKNIFSRAVLNLNLNLPKQAWVQLSRLLALAEKPELMPTQEWLKTAIVDYQLPIFRALPEVARR